MVHSDRELSLIPFPMEEIFDAKLDTFDVVIFQNFGYSEPGLSVSQYERNLERDVYKGGALVAIGGDHACGEGRANFPILTQALPVEPVGRPVSLDMFRPKLTPEGLRHPVTAFPGTGSIEGAWNQLPSLPGANITRAKNGATALMAHPFQSSDGHSAPIPARWGYVRGELCSVEAQEVVASQMGTTRPDGTARLEFAPPDTGAHKLLGSAKAGERDLGQAEDVVAVRAVGPELADASVRPDLMEQIAKATSGRAFRLPLSSLPEIPLNDPPLVEVGRSRDRPLWDRWYYLLALVALLGTEWMLRRRFGYI